jgi:hypothetical protein
MEKKLEYLNEGPGGYVVYKDDLGDIKLFFEYGGANCVVIIYVPSINEWESKTNRSLSQRQEVLAFVAEQSIKDQAPNCYYILSDICIEIFRKENKSNNT